MKQNGSRTARRRIIYAGCFLIFVMAGVLSEKSAEAATEVRMAPDGNAIEVNVGIQDGVPFTESIPIHRIGRVRYFSAGVGMAEREAVYPPFPLKVMFVAGEKAYLSRVAVTVADEKGTVVVQIPADHVTGPWLFLDLPAGRYTLSGRPENQAEARTSVQVATDRQKVVALRWPAAGPQQ